MVVGGLKPAAVGRKTLPNKLASGELTTAAAQLRLRALPRIMKSEAEGWGGINPTSLLA